MSLAVCSDSVTPTLDLLVFPTKMEVSLLAGRTTGFLTQLRVA